MVSSWKNNVLSAFDGKAGFYTDRAWIQGTVAAQLVHDLPVFHDSADILEVGCGTGILTRHLVDAYPRQRLCITDISPAMLKLARQNIEHSRVEWSVLDAETESTGKTYDLIVANMAMQWFERLKPGLANLQAMLKDRGTILFSLPGPQTFHEWREVLKELDFPCALLRFTIPKQGVYRRQKFDQFFPNAYAFLKSLKNTGASCGRQGIPRLSVRQLLTACEVLDSRGIKSFSWDILFVRLRREECIL